MFVKVREEAKQPVSAGGFWLSVLMVVLLVGFLGVEFGSGKAPHMSSGVDEALLAAAWAIALFQVARHGRRALPWPRVTLLVGYTLFLGGQAWPRSPLSGSWVQSAADLAILVGVLSPYVEFRRGRRVTSPDESGPAPEV